MDRLNLDVPHAWKAIQLEELQGLLFVIGAPDTGKTTFARYLVESIRSLGREAVLVDGDPGQSSIGPPTLLTLAYKLGSGNQVFRDSQIRQYFVGSTTPQGHMLPTLVGAKRLVEVAQHENVHTIVYDTSGLVDPTQGGLALKSAKIDLLRPSVIFALQCEHELEPLLVPVRRSGRARVVDLKPAEAVIPRNLEERRRYRAQQFASHFAGAKVVDLDWTKMAVFPGPIFRLNQLLALEDMDGFTLALGIVQAIDRSVKHVSLLTNLTSMHGVNGLRLGDILLDVSTFQDARIR